MPQEEEVVEDELCTWSHHPNVQGVPDDILLQAAKRCPGAGVTFTMGCHIEYTPEMIAKLEAEERALQQGREASASNRTPAAAPVDGGKAKVEAEPKEAVEDEGEKPLCTTLAARAEANDEDTPARGTRRKRWSADVTTLSSPAQAADDERRSEEATPSTVELKSKLKAMGAPIYGTKAQLAARLAKAVAGKMEAVVDVDTALADAPETAPPSPPGDAGEKRRRFVRLRPQKVIGVSDVA